MLFKDLVTFFITMKLGINISLHHRLSEIQTFIFAYCYAGFVDIELFSIKIVLALSSYGKVEFFGHS